MVDEGEGLNLSDGRRLETEAHQPVLVTEVLSCLVGPASGTYLDCTVGFGGHSEAILRAIGPAGRLFGIDRDGVAIEAARRRLLPYGDRVILRQAAFEALPQVMAALDVTEVDGILFDLGVSSFQLDQPERGFSFRHPGPLDMRMDQGQREMAADWVNGCSVRELEEIFSSYGEERWSRRIAQAIVRHREHEGPIDRTDTLEAIVWRAVPAMGRHGAIHPATRTFQALRIVVNREIDQLNAGILAALPLLAVGGRLVVLSFHSLEDRPVKRSFRAWTATPADSKEVPDRQYRLLHKKVIEATDQEIADNPRARSAKLRALTRVA